MGWMNRNLPSTVEPVSDMTGSLRSGVVLVRLIEQLSGQQVDKRIPNATYTLQMLENLLTAFKFMDRVGVSTEGYTVKDIFNGNEDKIVLMFESIRARFPNDVTAASTASTSFSPPVPAPAALPSPPLSSVTSGPSRSNGSTSSPLLGGAIPSGQPTGSLPAPPSGQPPKGSPRPPPPPSSNGSVGRSPKIGNGAPTSQPASSPSMSYQQQQQQPVPARMQAQNTGGSEFEALYDEAARSTIS